MIGLRWWRRARGLTQRELSARSGVQQRTISRIESGLVEEPRTRTLVKLAGALGVEPFDLLVGRDALAFFGAPEALVRGGHHNFTDASPREGGLSRGEQPEDITAAVVG